MNDERANANSHNFFTVLTFLRFQYAAVPIIVINDMYFPNLALLGTVAN